mmetsp:Transcript_4076/g.11823  ORF Transcript_4076/g.11823 Transcript_4076/m.11823 type:complete len:415 (+) Transcript_4076:742-1986(+)
MAPSDPVDQLAAQLESLQPKQEPKASLGWPHNAVARKAENAAAAARRSLGSASGSGVNTPALRSPPATKAGSTSDSGSEKEGGSERHKVLQALTYTQDLSGMALVEKPVPVPKPGEVLVRVLARPVNPSDIFACQGMFGATIKAPITPGTEGVGRVETDGIAFTKGQRVVGAPWPLYFGQGSWAQYCSVAEDVLVVVPDSISDAVAAQFFINPVSAFALLEKVKVGGVTGYMLLSAAGSTIGRLILQLAKAHKRHVIGVVRRASQRDELLALGASEIIATDEEDLVPKVMELTGGMGAEMAMDCVGGDFTGQMLRALRPGGTCYLFGALQSTDIQVGFYDLVGLEKRLESFNVWSWLATLTAEERRQKLKACMQLIVEGTLCPAEGTPYPLEDFKAALEDHRRPGRNSKVLLVG